MGELVVLPARHSGLEGPGVFISQIADSNGQLNGVVAAVAFIQTTAALNYSVQDISSMLATNYTSVFVTAQASAAVIQLARSLAMEWSPLQGGRLRRHPCHIEAPMVLELFKTDPRMKKKWIAENMMGRLATTGEFKGAALFLMSSASSFTTGKSYEFEF
ncbi:hypothetical protein MY11210_003095 [Beauveria gryllotalpidicola]